MCEDKADDAAKWFCFLDLFLETPLWHDADIEETETDDDDDDNNEDNDGDNNIIK